MTAPAIGTRPTSRRTTAIRGRNADRRTPTVRTYFTGNFIFSIPNFVRTPFFRSWQISGIARMWSGQPFDVTLSSDVAQIGAVQNQRPDMIAYTKGPRTVEQWFNINAFARPKT